jgi:hypothetical protein
MLKKLAMITLVTALALVGCAAAATPAPDVADGAYGYGGDADRQGYDQFARGLALPAMEMPAGAPIASQPEFSAQTGIANAVDRLVIKNASLSLVVKDPTESVNHITALAEGLGGFVVNSNVYQYSTDASGNKIMSASITIRVPAAKLGEALSQLKGMAVEVQNENISGEDVTAQYTDLESQLKNLEAAEAQLQKILEKATRTEDVLNVFNQLTMIRGQIEQVKGQMKYYSESAAMSLISLSLIPDALSQPIEVGGWKPEGVAKEALEALVRALQNIATGLIWAGVYLLPLALVFGVPGFLIIRLALRRMRKPKAVTAA